jgi:hypothetical protein
VPRSQIFDSKVAVGHAVHAVRGRSVKIKRTRGCAPVDREGGSRQCGRSQWRLVHPPCAIGKAAAVAFRHFIIGHQMMAERHRLGDLQMGEARHDAFGMFACAFDQRRLQSRALCRPRYRRTRTQRRKSVATWSLRDRAVCSRPAGSPISSRRRLSTCMWMSSSSICSGTPLLHIRLDLYPDR